MKESILEELLDIHQITERAIAYFKEDREQDVLRSATEIRDRAWSIKELIFKTRLLDAKISAKRQAHVVAVRRTAASLDDLLDLL